jgi:hypothetical protein
MRRTLSVGVLCLSATLAAACSAKTQGASVEDPNSFAGMNKVRIQYDCAQTRVCLEQMKMALAADCIQQEADQFEQAPDMQAHFLNTTSRCGALGGCDYYNCTMSHPQGYGETQMDKVSYACQQKVACRTERGQKLDDPEREVGNCIGDALGTLFNFSTTMRPAYETAFAKCSTMTSCGFSDCFTY